MFLPTDLQLSGAEPRIHDLRLADALGFERPRKLRDLITRWRAPLERFGEVSPHRGAKPLSGTAGGRPEEGFLLNKKQALFLCTKAETPAATEVTIAIVELFDAWNEGRLGAAAPPRALPWTRRRADNRVAWAQAQSQLWADRAAALAKAAVPNRLVFALRENEGLVRSGNDVLRVDFAAWQVVEGDALILDDAGVVRAARLKMDQDGFPAWACGTRKRVGFVDEPVGEVIDLTDGSMRPFRPFSEAQILGRIVERHTWPD